MAELTFTKLNPESHLLLDQPLLRLPVELSRKNFKLAAVHVEHDKKHLLGALKVTANDSLSGQKTPSETLGSLDSMINRMKNLKRKMEGFHDEEKTTHRQARQRLEHLHSLYQVPSLADAKYDEWSRIRLNRLLADYLLRNGYSESARALAKEKGIEDLVDLDVFVQCHKVEESLRRGSIQECLAWCSENRELTRKTNVSTCANLQLLAADDQISRTVSNSSSGYSNSLSFDGKVFFQKHSSMHESSSRQPRSKEILRSSAQLAYLHIRLEQKPNRTG